MTNGMIILCRIDTLYNQIDVKVKRRNLFYLFRASELPSTGAVIYTDTEHEIPFISSIRSLRAQSSAERAPQRHRGCRSAP
jgi:hypothetical protein